MLTTAEGTRPGRMLAALIASDNKKGRMELTVRVTPTDPAKAALHRTFTIKKWAPKDKPEAARLFIALPDTADWNAGIRPATPLTVNLQTGEVVADLKDDRITPQLRYAASQALRYARSGETASPGNGTVEVKESLLCGHCGAKLTDPVSIDRGVGPTCFGKATGSTAMKIGAKAGQQTITQLAAQIDGKTEIEHAQEALARAEERIANGDHSEAAYDGRDEAGKWLYKATVENAA